MSKRIDRGDLHHLSALSPIDPQDPGAFASWRILYEPGFLRQVDQFVEDDPPVSMRSRFRDVDWWLDCPPPASMVSPVISFQGISSELAAELKVAILVAIGHPAHKRLAMLSAISLGRGLALVGSWMTHAGFETISQLSEGCGYLFLQAVAELADQIQAGSHDSESGDWDPSAMSPSGLSKVGTHGLSGNLVKNTSNAFVHLYEARRAIEELTGARVRSAPFGTVSPHALVKRWAEVGSRTTERLPDVVREAVLRGATRFMVEPAADAIRIVRTFVEHMRTGLDGEEAAKATLAKFEFAVIVAEVRPWWALGRHMTWLGQLVRIVHTVRDAAASLILLSAGMRPQEMIGLMASPNLQDDASADAGNGAATLPRCVTEAPSKSGFSVLYLLHGHVFKRERLPRPVSWLLGGRQANGLEPTPILALRVLDELHGPLRPFAVDGASGMLIVDFVGDRHDPNFGTCHCTSGRLAASMRNSIGLFVDLSDLPDEEAGRDIRRYRSEGPSCIALYQFRKTYAQTLYQLDHRLLGAISKQLQHRCPLETKRVYVTQDPDFRRELQVGRSRHTALLARQVLDDVVPVHGTMASTIDGLLRGMRSPLDPAIRERLWNARLGDAGGLFGTDRLRPTAGMTSVMRAELDIAEPRRGDEAETSRTAAALHTFVGERRRWLAHLKDGNAASGREARERVLEAGRWLNGHGFPVGSMPEEEA